MDFLGLLKDIIDIVVVAERVVTRHIKNSSTEDCKESLEEIDESQD